METNDLGRIHRMSLGHVITGAVQKPLRLLLYGVDGVGKTTFAANAEDPIFIGTEDGTSVLGPDRFPEPRSWLDVMHALDELATAEHSYRTVVIDTLDWLEPLCWSHICGTGRKNKAGRAIKAIQDFDWGEGYSAALDEWRIFCSKLDRLRAERDMQSILIAHTWIKPFKNPEGEDFDRFEIKLHAKAAGLLREWCDAVLFATHEQYVYKATDKDRPRGISTGARILRTQRGAAWDAKNRFDLPEALPLDWPSLTEAIAARQTASPDTLRARITAQLEQITDAAIKDRVQRAMLAANDNASELARIQNKLTAQLTIMKTEAEK